MKERKLLQESESIQKLNSTVNALKLVLEPELFAKVLSGNFTLEDKKAVAKHIKGRLLTGKNLVFIKSILFKLLREIFLMFYYCSCNQYTDEELEFMENDEKERFLLNNLKVPVQELNEAFDAEEAKKELSTNLEETTETSKPNSWFTRKSGDPKKPFEANTKADDPKSFSLFARSSEPKVSNTVAATIEPKAEQSPNNVSLFERNIPEAVATPVANEIPTASRIVPEKVEPEKVKPKSFFSGIQSYFTGGGEVDTIIEKCMKRLILILQGPTNTPPEYMGAIITLIQLKPNDFIFALYGIYAQIMRTFLKRVSVSTRAKMLETVFPTVVSALLASDDMNAALSSFLSKMTTSSFKSAFKSWFGTSGGTRKATLRARGRISSRRRAAARAGP